MLTIAAETPEFLRKLRIIMEKLAPPEENGGNNETHTDYAYLSEKLITVKNACKLYDKKTAKEAINELRQISWPPGVKELLSLMAEHLLSGDYNEVSRTADAIEKII
jgi:hypothetical protein